MDEPASTNQPPPKPATRAAPNKPLSKKRFLKVAGIVVALLLGLFIFIGLFADTVTKYSVSDLVSENQGKISFSRPKQWQDASNIDKLTKDFGLAASNASIFGDKITKNKNGEDTIANAFVMFGESSDGSPTDVTIFKDPAVRAGFEKTMDTQLQADNFKSSDCQSIRDYSKNYNYDLNNIPVSVALKFNCQLSDAAQKENDVESKEVRMAIIIANDGKTYIYALMASDKSWAKNEPVYLRMLEDLKAKP